MFTVYTAVSQARPRRAPALGAPAPPLLVIPFLDDRTLNFADLDTSSPQRESCRRARAYAYVCPDTHHSFVVCMYAEYGVGLVRLGVSVGWAAWCVDACMVGGQACVCE